MSQAASALGVRGPRQSVGVQVEGGAYCVMLPYSVCAPCSAKQIFTTTQDNQSQVTLHHTSTDVTPRFALLNKSGCVLQAL